jgi:hypothetical protein
MFAFLGLDCRHAKSRPALRFEDAAGRWHTVEACNRHRAEQDGVQRVNDS